MILRLFISGLKGEAGEGPLKYLVPAKELFKNVEVVLENTVASI